MAKCRNFMQGLSIIITVLLLVCAVFMTVVGFSSGYGNRLPTQLEPWSSDHGVLLLRVFGPITVVLSVLGICAATTDIKPLLLLLSAVMFVEFVVLMVVASPLVQLQTQMDGVNDELFVNVTPLYRESTQFQTNLNDLQAKEACCGLRSYSDWKEQFLASCICSPLNQLPHSEVANSTIDGSCVLALTSLKEENSSNETWVHAKPCGPILKSNLSLLFKLCIGVISAVATVMISAIVLSLVFGLEEYWRAPPVETTVDDYNRVKYQPKPLLT
ncbi:uncharacterized protein LOC130109654 isoform X3 [Lampris incognitus]|uniref:uncharacterized protein LOC130109654 isoform X3 n=1 Tax=Lampris incognitus TaxID=2546036 RepID=UPI0024B62DEF|nr:uncharacterized protein LOC130109654 isoform X3 [Lampris incognitus]